MDREGCVNFDFKTKLDSFLSVRTKLGEIVKERRKDKEKFGKEK